MPPGRSRRIARLLISLYPRSAGFDALLVFRKRRRIEDDRVVALPLLVPFPQKIEGICLDALDVPEPVPLRIGASQLDGAR